MSKESQTTYKPPKGGTTVIGNAPLGPREFDPGQWGQIALERKMAGATLHPNFENVREELSTKYGCQISDSGLLEGRISTKLDSENQEVSFSRPSIALKNFKGVIKEWNVSIPVVADMPHRLNFPKFIGNLGSVEDVLRLIVDYQNWFGHLRNTQKRANKARKQREAIPGSFEYAKAKSTDRFEGNQVNSTRSSGSISISNSKNASNASTFSSQPVASGSSSQPSASQPTASQSTALQSAASQPAWTWPDFVEKAAIPEKSLLDKEENKELKSKLKNLDPKYLHCPTIISLTKSSDQDELIVIWNNFFSTQENDKEKFNKIDVEAEMNKDRMMSRHPQQRSLRPTPTQTQQTSILTEVAKSYSSATAGSSPNPRVAAGRSMKGPPNSTLDMGGIPSVLGAQIPTLKEMKELTITCKLKRPEKEAIRPKWTPGKWVSWYQDLIAEAEDTEGFENFLDPPLLKGNQINKYGEGLLKASTKDGMNWLLGLIKAKFPEIEVTLWQPPPPVWGGLVVNIGSLPIKEGDGKGSAKDLLLKVLKVNKVSAWHPELIRSGKIKTETEAITGNILRRTIQYDLHKEDFDTIKTFMDVYDRNYFNYVEALPFFLLTPNGRVIEWSKRSSKRPASTATTQQQVGELQPGPHQPDLPDEATTPAPTAGQTVDSLGFVHNGPPATKKPKHSEVTIPIPPQEHSFERIERNKSPVTSKEAETSRWANEDPMTTNATPKSPQKISEDMDMSEILGEDKSDDEKAVQNLKLLDDTAASDSSLAETDTPAPGDNDTEMKYVYKSHKKSIKQSEQSLKSSLFPGNKLKSSVDLNPPASSVAIIDQDVDALRYDPKKLIKTFPKSFSKHSKGIINKTNPVMTTSKDLVARSASMTSQDLNTLQDPVTSQDLATSLSFGTSLTKALPTLASISQPSFANSKNSTGFINKTSPVIVNSQDLITSQDLTVSQDLFISQDLATWPSLMTSVTKASPTLASISQPSFTNIKLSTCFINETSLATVTSQDLVTLPTLVTSQDLVSSKDLITSQDLAISQDLATSPSLTISLTKALPTLASISQPSFTNIKYSTGFINKTSPAIVISQDLVTMPTLMTTQDPVSSQDLITSQDLVTSQNLVTLSSLTTSMASTSQPSSTNINHLTGFISKTSPTLQDLVTLPTLATSQDLVTSQDLITSQDLVTSLIKASSTLASVSQSGIRKLNKLFLFFTDRSNNLDGRWFSIKNHQKMRWTQKTPWKRAPSNHRTSKLLTDKLRALKRSPSNHGTSKLYLKNLRAWRRAPSNHRTSELSSDNLNVLNSKSEKSPRIWSPSNTKGLSTYRTRYGKMHLLTICSVIESQESKSVNSKKNNNPKTKNSVFSGNTVSTLASCLSENQDKSLANLSPNHESIHKQGSLQEQRRSGLEKRHPTVIKRYENITLSNNLNRKTSFHSYSKQQLLKIRDDKFSKNADFTKNNGISKNTSNKQNDNIYIDVPEITKGSYLLRDNCLDNDKKLQISKKYLSFTDDPNRISTKQPIPDQGFKAVQGTSTNTKMTSLSKPSSNIKRPYRYSTNYRGKSIPSTNSGFQNSDKNISRNCTLVENKPSFRNRHNLASLLTNSLDIPKTKNVKSRIHNSSPLKASPADTLPSITSSISRTSSSTELSTFRQATGSRPHFPQAGTPCPMSESKIGQTLASTSCPASKTLKRKIKGTNDRCYPKSFCTSLSKHPKKADQVSEADHVQSVSSAAALSALTPSPTPFTPILATTPYPASPNPPLASTPKSVSRILKRKFEEVSINFDHPNKFDHQIGFKSSHT